DGGPGLHQHGREPGRAAHQGPDAAADELRRIGPAAQRHRAGHLLEGGHGESPTHARRPSMTDMSTSPRHLVIMAAGTGGHIMPGLAVADEMKRRGWAVSWLGTQGGMENRLVPPAGIPLDTISFSGLRGKGAKGALLGGFKLLKGFAECARILKTRQATAVLGMGGYVCFPGGLMAKARGLPLVMVNADAALLLSNKALLP